MERGEQMGSEPPDGLYTALEGLEEPRQQRKRSTLTGRHRVRHRLNLSPIRRPRVSVQQLVGGERAEPKTPYLDI